MRTVTFYLFIAISLFSLACGFYDLYKNVPFLNTMLKNVVGNMYLPFIHWLEEHTKVSGRPAETLFQSKFSSYCTVVGALVLRPPLHRPSAACRH